MASDFSIIIPTCDRPTLLPNAVRSALNAAKSRGSVLIVDDGRNFPASKTLSGFSASNLEVVCNPGPRGPGATRNFGVRHTTAEVIFFLDDDDVIAADYCDRIMGTAIPHNARPSFGFSAVREGAHLRRHKLPTGLISSTTRLSRRLAGLGMGFWIRREAFQSVGGIDEVMPVNEDTDFCLRLAASGLRGWYDPVAAVTLRPEAPASSDASSITRATDATRRGEAFTIMLGRHAHLLANHRRTRRQFIRRVIKYSSRALDWEHAQAVTRYETNWPMRQILSLEIRLRQMVARP